MIMNEVSCHNRLDWKRQTGTVLPKQVVPEMELAVLGRCLEEPCD